MTMARPRPRHGLGVSRGQEKRLDCHSNRKIPRARHNNGRTSSTTSIQHSTFYPPSVRLRPHRPTNALHLSFIHLFLPAPQLHPIRDITADLLELCQADSLHLLTLEDAKGLLKIGAIPAPQCLFNQITLWMIETNDDWVREFSVSQIFCRSALGFVVLRRIHVLAVVLKLRVPPVRCQRVSCRIESCRNPYPTWVMRASCSGPSATSWPTKRNKAPVFNQALRRYAASRAS